MSEEANAVQDNTDAAVATETQAQAPASEGEKVLRPAAEILAEQAKETAPVEAAKAEEAEPQEAGEKDLGLLAGTKPTEAEAPAEYEAFTMPEGMELEADDAKVLQEIAKENNFSQSEAQAGAVMTATALSKLIAESQAQQQAYREEQKKVWEAQPDHGVRTLLAEKALKHAGLLDYCAENGYTHDSQLMKVFSEFGKLVSEAKVIVGSESSPASSSNPYTHPDSQVLK